MQFKAGRISIANAPLTGQMTIIGNTVGGRGAPTEKSAGTVRDRIHRGPMLIADAG